MSFSSFYDQPLRQILSEVIKLSRREKARHDANILATSSKALPDIELEVPQIDFDNATPKVNEPSLVGIDRALRQIENARKLLGFKESATNGTVSVIPIKTKKCGTVPAVADAGLDRIRAAHSISDITDSPIEASRRVFGSEETILNDAVPLVPVKSKARNSVPVATDVGLHQIKDAQFTSDVTDPQKASQVIVGSEEAVSNEAISIVPVMFEEHSAVTVATDVGLDRIKAALCTPDVTDSSVKVANSTCDVAVSPVKVCKYFLSRRGCRYKHNCQSFHDHNAMATPREQLAANDAKNKLQQVRTNQQTAFMREVLALKSNNANIPVAVAKSSKPSPKRSSKKKRPACKNFQSSDGCVRKNFPFPHDEPEKLIDDTVPGEILKISNTISSSQVPKYPKAILHKRKTKKKSPKATVVKTSEPEQVFSAAKPIVWEGNPNLGDEAYCTRAILQIFGKFAPTKEEAIEWCKEMGVNRNFRHFNNFDNLTMWGRAINLNTDEFLIHIGYLPEIPVQFTFKMQLYIKELRAAYEAEQARPKYDTFHRFDDLPNELCMKIWGFAVRSGRTLTVSLNRDTIYTEGGPGLFKRRRGTSPSPLWLVNKQAQKACMLDKSCAFYFGCDYFSSRFDTLFLNDSAENFNLYATQIAQWRGNVVQRLSFPHYRLCDITDMRLFATSLYKAFPNLIRLEFSLSDGEYWSKYREKAHKVVEGADTEIAKVYKRRGANIKLPRVRFVLVPEEQAMGMGIGGIGW